MKIDAALLIGIAAAAAAVFYIMRELNKTSAPTFSVDAYGVVRDEKGHAWT